MTTESLAFELDLPHSPAKVWRALTEPELLEQWLLPVLGHRLEPGATFRFQAPPQPHWDGTVNCRMLEIRERELISWAWVVGDIDTVLTITLTPSERGTRLDIVQSGFRSDQKQASGGARYGWKKMTGQLTDLLERMP